MMLAALQWGLFVSFLLAQIYWMLKKENNNKISRALPACKKLLIITVRLHVSSFFKLSHILEPPSSCICLCCRCMVNLRRRSARSAQTFWKIQTILSCHLVRWYSLYLVSYVCRIDHLLLTISIFIQCHIIFLMKRLTYVKSYNMLEVISHVFHLYQSTLFHVELWYACAQEACILITDLSTLFVKTDSLY